MPFTLLERLEVKLEATPGQLQRACVELGQGLAHRQVPAKARGDADRDRRCRASGQSPVRVMCWSPNMGSRPSGRAGTTRSPPRAACSTADKDAETIARDAMAIAADICVYTNGNLTVERITA
jgi:ATP-dependent HslUV protease subunit HslV